MAYRRSWMQTRELSTDILNFLADHPGIPYLEFYKQYGAQTNTPLSRMIHQLRALLRAGRIRKEGPKLFVDDIRSWKW